MRKRKAQRVNQSIMRGVVAMALVVLLVCYLFLTLVGCSPAGERFHVQGTISDAPDSTLLLEAMTLSGVQPVDSVRLDAEGSFDFAVVPDTCSAPEFYRLRIGSQVINFVVDSLEDIQIQAPFDKMASAYEIQGNEASRTMKTISLMNIQLQQQIARLDKETSLSAMEKAERAQEMVETYKTTLKHDIILADPASPAAYFALFQTIGGQMLFNPENNKNDVQYFAAVATQWELSYPGALRTENLRNIAIRGLRNTRQARQVEIEIDGEKVREIGIIDFGFKDILGQERRLTDFADKVILLDFTAYQLPASQQRIIELRELYSKYHSRGLEIYQVSLDADEHYWKTMCEALPWVCVHCPEGFNNDMVRLYNIQAIPTYFLIGRGSEMKARGEDIPDIQKAIETEL
ncbi:MAG: redoxin domain-containing protein [Bacteroidaceae bacterium]|nr:redoxin domain-containing protein [Bacteroidaceae bacterium]